MRIKALLCAAAFAVSAVTCMAQNNVYSLNVVGYHQVTVGPSAYGLIANQLNTTNNTIGALLPSVPPDTILYKYGGAGWAPYVFDAFDLKWTPDANATLNPGEGALVKNATAQNMTLTFVGEVMQGTLNNPLPAGFAVRSSMVPQAGKVTTDLGYPAAADDIVYKYVPGTGFAPYVFDAFDLKWTPDEPTFAVGEAFMSKKGAAATWTRSFTVPQQ